MLVGQIKRGLMERGLAHVAGGFDRRSYRELAAGLGAVLAEEAIALRPGAHAYVAKSGRVPFHTDHPDVNLVGWLCEEQDELDGASLLLDARPIIEAMSEAERQSLRQLELICPPLAGGPPTEKRPVLRPHEDGDAIFCSPWLRQAGSSDAGAEILERLRASLSDAARDAPIEVRLRAGDVLFADNCRVLHGRRAISESSPRRLLRLWIRLRKSSRSTARDRSFPSQTSLRKRAFT